MRRDAAKRKLASQQARRAQQAARRRRIAVISSAAVVVLVLVGVVALSTIGRGGKDAIVPPAASVAPTATRPAAAPGACSYPTEGSAAKKNDPPQSDGVPHEGSAAVAITTSVG